MHVFVGVLRLTCFLRKSDTVKISNKIVIGACKTMINSGETQIKILIIPYIQKHIVKGKKDFTPWAY